MSRNALMPSNLVIADAAGPVAIAGVIGGLESAITPSTRRLVLESANFQAAGIRGTSSKLKLRTDASMRFEKAQDPVNTVRGLARAVALLREVSPGIQVVGGLADSYRPAPPRPPIELPMDWLIRKLGRDIEPERVRGILEALQFGVNETAPRVFAVTVPSWRATKDISIKDDLTEEVGRMIGYDSIAPRPPLVPSTVPPGNPTRRYHHQVRSMAAAQGYTEVCNYSFVSEAMAARFGFAPQQHVRVANPISAEQGLLRTSLLPGLYRNITENARHFARFRLFEIGYEIRPRPEAEGPPGSEERLPDEIPHFAAVHYGGDHKGEGLMELKRLAECLCPGAGLLSAAARPFEHPARTAEVLWQGEPVGRIFELHPSYVESRAAILDLDLAAAERLAAGRVVRYKPVRRYPSSAFDLSVIVPARALVGDLQRSLEQLGGADLVSLDFLRQYEGAPLAEGTKSVSFRLVVGAADRTLSSEEAGAIRQRIIDGMRALGYDLRV